MIQKRNYNTLPNTLEIPGNQKPLGRIKPLIGYKKRKNETGIDQDN
jgi:hypothetical protein